MNSQKLEIKPNATTIESLLLMHELCLDICAEFDYFGGTNQREKVKADLAHMMAGIFFTMGKRK